MVTTVVGARMSKRELAIASVAAEMPYASPAQITRYAYRRFLGDTHEQARRIALNQDKAPFENPSTEEKKISVRIPKEWSDAAKEQLPGFNASTVHRYVIASVTAETPAEAESIASRKRGRPRKTQTEAS